MTRHEQREEVMKLVFCIDMQRAADPETDAADIARRYLESGIPGKMTPREAAAVYRKALDIASMFDTLDREISAASSCWPIQRIGKAELQILRVAVFEIRHSDSVPAKVAVDEAVELAKTYCGGNAPSFINGLLREFL